MVVDTSIRECQAHKELQGEVAADMERTAADIAVLKEQVAHERVIRANKEEYAILAKQAEKLPPRSKTEKDKASCITLLILNCTFLHPNPQFGGLNLQAALNEQLARLEEQTCVQTQKMELRKKQFQVRTHTYPPSFGFFQLFCVDFPTHFSISSRTGPG